MNKSFDCSFIYSLTLPIEICRETDMAGLGPNWSKLAQIIYILFTISKLSVQFNALGQNIQKIV